jgi:5-formyltetrahydrofolate cyclo-ligase
MPCRSYPTTKRLRCFNPVSRRAALTFFSLTSKPSPLDAVTSIDKNQARVSSGRPEPARCLALAGQVAEHLRRLEKYRQASQLFIDPSPLLKQARINALADGKLLIMPGPGLKEGFYRLDPYRIPFSKLALAAAGRELPSFGQKITARSEVSLLKVELLIGEYWAVDERGYGVGEGKGFFDLAMALLAELEGLADDYRVMVAVQDRCRLVAGLPVDPWDIAANGILTPEKVIMISQISPRRPDIVWEALTLDRIRRITPLWKLYVEQGRDR